MNKQELKKRIEDLPYNAGLIVDTIKISRNGLLKLIEQLDEPQKPVVPQFVADWIEEARTTGQNIKGALVNAPEGRVSDWLELYNVEVFAKDWVNGYTIEPEKEKRYTVVTKVTKQPLYYNAMDKKLFFSMGGLATKFTRKELEEAGFGWVFDCSGIEVQE